MKSLFPDAPEEQPAPELIKGNDVETRGTLAAFATFSACGSYRYVLGRVWNDHGALLVVCMLNPSTATEEALDPTLRRVRGFALRDHYGGFLVVNAFALRSTDPRMIKQWLYQRQDPAGPRNDEAIVAAVENPLLAKFVVAWGRPANKAIERRMTYVRTLPFHRTLWTFGPKTNGGFPRHPLYLKSDVPIVKYNGVTR
jgi:hypothetical protein